MQNLSRSRAVWPSASSSCIACIRQLSTTSALSAPSSRPSPTSARGKEPRFNYVANPFDSTPDPDSSTYKMVTAKDLTNRQTPPRRVKMLARDFIDDCLYNPNYGYFSTQVEIFDPDTVKNGKRVETGGSKQKKRNSLKSFGEMNQNPNLRAEGFQFTELSNTREFEDEVAARYGEFEGTAGKGPGRQVWHTPTELFKPWYGRAIARYLVSEYKLNLFPYEDLIIYEIGAGNGTLMGDILDYIAECEPEVYERTRYRIVEISERLQTMQRGRATQSGGGGGDAKAALKGPAKRKGHAEKVEVLASSIFDWQKIVPEPCFFLAMEVLDNFAHDVIRYTTQTHEPFQCVVSVDSTGDYTELYEPVTDPLIGRYLSLRSRLPNSSQRRSPLLNPVLAASPLLRQIYSAFPFAPNLTPPEFLPTKQLMLLDVLKEKFPNHRILFSDFSNLPDTIPGKNAPVVQTRYQGETVACTTYLVQPGFFDIFFPTDFNLLKDFYSLVMNSNPSQTGNRFNRNFFSSSTPRTAPNPTVSASGSGQGWNRTGGVKAVRGLNVIDHADFLERYAELDMTRLRDGTNPMLEYYENTAFIC